MAKLKLDLIVNDKGAIVIKNFGKTTTAVMKRSVKSVKAVSGALTSMQSLVISLTAAIGGMRLAGSFIDAASEAEGYRIRLTALLKSQEEGNRLFKEMAEFAGRVPFEYRQIMGAATSLAGVMKGGVDEITQWMPMIGDLAAVTGLSIEETTGQVIRMYSAGAASADMFRERGILSMLGFQAGVSYTAEETRKIMMKEWKKADSQFRGVTDDLGDSWTGLVSMMSDEWFAFRSDFMEKSGLFEYAKASIQTLLGITKDFKNEADFDDWAAEIGDQVIDGFENALLGAAGFYDSMAPIFTDVKDEVSGMWDTYETVVPEWARPYGLLGAVLLGPKGMAGAVAYTKIIKEAREFGENLGAGKLRVGRPSGAFNPQVAPLDEMGLTGAYIADPGLASSHDPFVPLVASHAIATGAITETTEATGKATKAIKSYTDRLRENLKALKDNATSSSKTATATGSVAASIGLTSKELDSLNKLWEQANMMALPDHERAVQKINDQYWALRDQLPDLVGHLGITFDQVSALDEKLAIQQANAITGLSKSKTSNKRTASDIEKIWAGAYDRMTDELADWIKSGEVGLDSLVDYFGSAVSQMVAAWLMGQAQMSFNMSGNVSGGFGGQSLGTTMTNLPGGTWDLAKSAGSMFTGAGLGGFQVGAAEFASDTLGMTALGDFIVDGLSSAVFGGLTAGVATLIITGDPVKAAGSGLGGWAGATAGTALGAEIGGTIGSVVPVVGTIIGAMLGSALAGAFGPGESQANFGPAWLGTGNLVDRSFDPTRGFEDTGYHHPDIKKQYFADIANAYNDTLEGIQAAYNDIVFDLVDTMPAEISEAMLNNLAGIDFGDLAAAESAKIGNVAVSDFGPSMTRLANSFASRLDQTLADAYAQAIGGYISQHGAAGLLDDSGAWQYLTDTIQAEIETMFTGAAGLISSGDVEAGIQQIRDVSEAVNSITTALAPVSAIIDTAGMKEYQLQIAALDQQFSDYGSVLQAAGIDLAKYTDLEEARAIKFNELAVSLFSEVDSIIASGAIKTLSSDLNEIGKWAQEQNDIARSLIGHVDQADIIQHISDIQSAAVLQAEDLINNYITPITDAWKDFFTDIAFSDLAPVTSAGQYGIELANLQELATGGDLAATQDLMDFVRNDYLPFWQSFTGEGPAYNDIFDSLLGQDGSLRNTTIDMGEVSIDSANMTSAFLDALRQWAAEREGSGQPITLILNDQVLAEAIGEDILTAGPVFDAIAIANGG